MTVLECVLSLINEIFAVILKAILFLLMHNDTCDGNLGTYLNVTLQKTVNGLTSNIELS